MRHVKIKTPRKPARPLWVRILAIVLAFTAGWLVHDLMGIWLVWRALVNACLNGMFICS